MSAQTQSDCSAVGLICRRQHSHVISAHLIKKTTLTAAENTPETSDLADDVVITFQSEQCAKKDLDKKSEAGLLTCVCLICHLLGKRRKLQAVGSRDRANYINYQPRDHLSEQGLSLHTAGFDAQASSAVLDLDGDDEESMRRAKSSRLKW